MILLLAALLLLISHVAAAQGRPTFAIYDDNQKLVVAIDTHPPSVKLGEGVKPDLAAQKMFEQLRLLIEKECASSSTPVTPTKFPPKKRKVGD